MIGQTISHYRIIEKLSRGGMGVVYKAEDLSLGRMVALKFLPDDLAKNPRMLLRLKREARAASALNHPNICTVYAIEEHDGQSFIAMELLDGCSLKERIAQGRIELRQALDWAMQIAEALEAAHTKGIVHRDLKPGNMFIIASGQVKVLDFGIAKLTPFEDEADVQSATSLAEELTLPGAAIGTVAYMSPEQVRADDIDARSDLFSFGVVLYEMITGKRAFPGKSVGVVFERIINGEPRPVREIVSGCPQSFDEIVKKLLKKDPAFRYRSAADVKSALVKARIEIERPRHQSRSSVRGPLGAAAVAVMLGLLGYVAWTNLRPASPPRHDAVFTQLTNQVGAELFPVLSRDGKSFLYASARAGNWDIYLQRVSGQNATNLTQDSPADDTQPALSPDGESIVFRSERDGGGIFVMGATGESVRRLSDFGFNPTWSPDGKEIAIAETGMTEDPNNRAGVSALWAIEVSSGKRRLVTRDDAMQPSWSPHGYRIAYWASHAGQRDIWTIKPDGSSPVRVTSDVPLSWNPVWSPDGRYLYFSSDRDGIVNLWRIPIDENTARKTGPAEPITTGGGLTQRAQASFSGDGRKLAYVEQSATENIQRVRFDPASGKTLGKPEVVTEVSATVTIPDVSPDGQWVAFQSWGHQEDIYVMKSDGSGEKQLTNDIYKDRLPRFSPDGRRIAFFSNRSGNFEIWIIGTDGSGLQQITKDGNATNTRSVWSPDGLRLAGFHEGRGSYILELSTGSREVLPSMADPSMVFDVWSWSPDGRWLAGHKRASSSGQPGGIALYDTETKNYLDLTNEGTGPVWLGDNRRLMFDRTGQIGIVDRTSRKVETLDAFRPDGVRDLGRGGVSLPKDNRFIYFSVRMRQADIWLLSLP